MQESSEKENKKVQTDNQSKDNIVREGQADNSIRSDKNKKSTNSYKGDDDKKFKDENESADKSTKEDK